MWTISSHSTQSFAMENFIRSPHIPGLRPGPSSQIEFCSHSLHAHVQRIAPEGNAADTTHQREICDLILGRKLSNPFNLHIETKTTTDPADVGLSGNPKCHHALFPDPRALARVFGKHSHAILPPRFRIEIGSA